ncbi:expressed unknown protein [Seminavis robusta]|uniref:Uncharacterized protein n=1 Tax=Seminavis robusta TaxID=568900 RepID=A0A9N8E084_9STRA|nr:expressed unknown protein [Seminavis robusta]|eukprot:Sro520_g159190.1 n/a (339) ;mRNA; f:46597-47613
MEPGCLQKNWCGPRGANLAWSGFGWNTSSGLCCGVVLGLRVLPSPVGPAVLGVDPIEGTGVPSEELGVGPGVPTLPGVGLGGTLPVVSVAEVVLGLRVLPSPVGPAVLGVDPIEGTGVPSEELGVGPGVPTFPGWVWVEHYQSLCCDNCARAQSAAFPVGPAVLGVEPTDGTGVPSEELGVGPGVPTLPGVGLGGTLPVVSVVEVVLGLRVLPSPVGPAVLGVDPIKGTGVPSEELGVGPGVPTFPGVGLGGTLPEVSVVTTVLGLRVLPSPVGPAVLVSKQQMALECLQKNWGLALEYQPYLEWVWVEHFQMLWRCYQLKENESFQTQKLGSGYPPQ